MSSCMPSLQPYYAISMCTTLLGTEAQFPGAGLGCAETAGPLSGVGP